MEKENSENMLANHYSCDQSKQCKDTKHGFCQARSYINEERQLFPTVSRHHDIKSNYPWFLLLLCGTFFSPSEISLENGFLVWLFRIWRSHDSSGYDKDTMNHILINHILRLHVAQTQPLESSHLFYPGFKILLSSAHWIFCSPTPLWSILLSSWGN